MHLVRLWLRPFHLFYFSRLFLTVKGSSAFGFCIPKPPNSTVTSPASSFYRSHPTRLYDLWFYRRVIYDIFYMSLIIVLKNYRYQWNHQCYIFRRPRIDDQSFRFQCLLPLDFCLLRLNFNWSELNCEQHAKGSVFPMILNMDLYVIVVHCW